MHYANYVKELRLDLIMKNIKTKLVINILFAWFGICLAVADLKTESNPKMYEIDTKNQVLKQKQAWSRSTPLLGFRLETIDAKIYSLEKAGKPFVLLFLSTQCPVANQYIPRINRLRQTYPDTEVLGIYSNQEDHVEKIAQHVQRMKINFPVVRDFDSKLAQQIGAMMTPQAFLVNSNGEIFYAGSIDDNRYSNRVKNTYLADAIEEMLAGKRVTISQTKSFGCTIHQTEISSDQITYSRHIAPILQRHCQNCHRPDQVAPFSLLNYQDAKIWSTEIVSYTQKRLMPPWKAAKGYGEFKREKWMEDWEVDLLSDWVESGMIEGNLTDLPIPIIFNDGWSHGYPDLVVEMPTPYDIPAEGEDEYRHFVIPTDFDKDMYVSAFDVKPGNPRSVHHVIIYLDTSGRARELDAEDPQPGYSRFGGTGFDAAGWLGGWAPGIMPSPHPDGTGYLLPKGADIVLQIHYYKTGRVESDLSRVGLYFCDSVDPKQVHVAMAINNSFQIPADNSNYEVVAEWQPETDVYAVSVSPHMHLIGSDMRVTAVSNNGKIQDLIWIKDWDFSWQSIYHFRQPVFMPAGTIVRAVGHFDNSATNPNNPNHPPKTVTWGEKTTDEMFIAFLDVIEAKDFQPKEISTLPLIELTNQ